MIPTIVLAPLAGGPSTPELAAAVSNAGGLGFLAAGYLTPEALHERIRETRTLTDHLLGVNVFVPSEDPIDRAALADYVRELEPEAAACGVQLGEPHFDDDHLDAKIELLVGADIQVVSTTFGCLPRGGVERLQASGKDVWATVTSLDEARVAHTAGVDALVVQGSEAGGHSGTWTSGGAASPLLELIDAIDVELPLVAAGGIASRAAVVAALGAGAVAAQVGTAFLLSPEAGTNVTHRAALQHGGATAFTRAFTGRTARGIVNRFMLEHPDAPAAYPHIHYLTAPLRAAARERGDAERTNLWAGINFAQAQELPAAEIVASLRA